MPVDKKSKVAKFLKTDTPKTMKERFLEPDMRRSKNMEFRINNRKVSEKDFNFYLKNK